MSVKQFAVFCSGAMFSLLLILSCSDDSPDRADAASCECPLAEPPLAGRAIEVQREVTLPAANIPPKNGQGVETVDCPRGSFLLSGGCAASVGAVPDTVIEASWPSSDSWVCVWKNNSNEPVPVRAIARCLMPAQ
jgi:hypothetical protein